MADPNVSLRMSIPLTDIKRRGRSFEFAEDLRPCTACANCRPDITEMVKKTAIQYCIVCNHPGRSRCSQCLDAQYCSVKCQRTDWGAHKVVCKQFKSVHSSSRPTNNHFRVILFPVEASQPQFCWASSTNSNDLVLEHATIGKWKADEKANYDQSDEDPLVVHALSRDLSMKGKMLEHGIRVASWQPPKGPSGHRHGFNQTISALSTALSDRRYGPVVAFAYTLSSNFEYEGLDDMTTNDFRHIVDYLHNSDWNPTVNEIDRYPGTTLPALLILDPTRTSSEEASICDIQTCWHFFCDPFASPIKQMCLGGAVWHTFLLGPLLLGLPWIGRNVRITDVFDTEGRTSYGWQYSIARFLGYGARIGHKFIEVRSLPISDGLAVFHAFGAEIHEFHLLAYDEFIHRNMIKNKSKRLYTQSEFCKLWDQLKTNKTALTAPGHKKGQRKLDFSGIPSPYHVPAGAQLMLFKEMKVAFLFLRDLFQDQQFRKSIRGYETEIVFREELSFNRWRISEFWKDHLDDLIPKYGPPQPAREDSSTARDEEQARTADENDLANLAAASLKMMGL